MHGGHSGVGEREGGAEAAADSRAPTFLIWQLAKAQSAEAAEAADSHAPTFLIWQLAKAQSAEAAEAAADAIAARGKGGAAAEIERAAALQV